ncbi:hypothetical protein [Sphingomonas sp. CLY1604]|uniref:hypothetical protein n=1 Tax=Sphingomonas sp. CLY1604 TaxID=3457786 RepID=UPI003FD868C6
MSKVREQLLWKALCAVDEAAEEADAGPVRPTFALRFALAYLYACGSGERWMYDAFWREIQAPPLPDGKPSPRGTMARSGLQGIMRSVGITPTNESLAALTARRRRIAPDAIARRHLARQLREAGDAQTARIEDKARDKDCGWL